MKSLIILVSILLIVTQLFSQKVSKEKIDVKYTQLPMTPLSSDIKTFSTKTIVKEGGAYRIGDKYVAKIGEVVSTGKEYKGVPEVKFKDMRAEYEEKYLKIEGYQKTASNADLTVAIEFDLLIIKKSETVSEYYNSNKKRCAVTKYNYTLPCKLYIITKNGKELLNQVISNQDYEYSKNVTECHDKTGDTDHYYELSENAVIPNYKKAQGLIRNSIAKIEMSDVFLVYSPKGKTYDYSELEKASTDFIIAIQTLNVTKDDNKAKETIKSAIETWKKAITETDFINKKAKINKEISCALNYNCALAFWILNDFENAKKSIIDAKSEFEKEASNLENIILDNEKRYHANVKG